jgi:hypothetical protein
MFTWPHGACIKGVKVGTPQETLDLGFTASKVDNRTRQYPHSQLHRRKLGMQRDGTAGLLDLGFIADTSKVDNGTRQSPPHNFIEGSVCNATEPTHSKR